MFSLFIGPLFLIGFESLDGKFSGRFAVGHPPAIAAAVCVSCCTNRSGPDADASPESAGASRRGRHREMKTNKTSVDISPPKEKKTRPFHLKANKKKPRYSCSAQFSSIQIKSREKTHGPPVHRVDSVALAALSSLASNCHEKLSDFLRPLPFSLKTRLGAQRRH